jgi:predicted dehydrogenase
VVALARRNYKEATAFAAEATIDRIYTGYDDLLKDKNIDAVLTAVPIELNGTVLLAALRAGKHVLAEKPIAATLDEARVIVQEADSRRQVVLIGENFRYRHDIMEVKKLIGSGAIGDVFAFQLSVNFDITATRRKEWISRGWRHEARHIGGFVLDAGVHPIAALREILGEVGSVWAQTLDVSSLIHGPDGLLMQVQMKSGVAGHCFFCYTAKEASETALDFVILGSGGVLHAGRRMIRITRGLGRQRESIRTAGSQGEYLRQWKNFCAAIRGEQEIVSTARKAYGDLAVVDAALRSSADAKPYMVSREFNGGSRQDGVG